MTKTSKEAIRAIDELNSKKRTKFPSQKDISREELVKVCQLFRFQLDEALKRCQELEGKIQRDQNDQVQEQVEAEVEQDEQGEQVHGGQDQDQHHGDHNNQGYHQKEQGDKDEAEDEEEQFADASEEVQSQPTITVQKPKGNPVCRFHKYKKCYRKKSCKFDHPKMCSKYLAFGSQKTNAEKGCNRSECQDYHPPLCYGSAKYMECRSRGCKKRHLPGTKFTRKSNPSPKQPKNVVQVNKSKNKKSFRKSRPSPNTKKAPEYSRDSSNIPLPTPVPTQDMTYSSVVKNQPGQHWTQVPQAAFLGQTTPGLLEHQALELAKQLLTKALLGQQRGVSCT